MLKNQNPKGFRMHNIAYYTYMPTIYMYTYDVYL